jgi:type II secretion system protein G
MKKLNSAFTMIEMMVVLFIIGFIAAIVVPQVTKYMRSAEEARMKLRMSTIKSALMNYKMEFGVFPTTRDGGLTALFENPKPSNETYRKAEREGKWPFIAEGEKSIEEVIYNCPPEKFPNKYRSYEIIWIGRGTEDEPSIEMGE